MLVTRQSATEQNPWSISKFDTVFHRSAESLRMSNNFDSVTQSDWQGQYSFLPPGDNGLFSQTYDHVANSSDHSDSQAQPRTVAAPSNALDIEAPKQENSPLLGHRLDPLGLRQAKQPSPIPEQPENTGEQYAHNPTESTNEESVVSTETPGMSLGSNPVSSISSKGPGPEALSNQSGNERQIAVKEEDEDVIEDDEMGDGDLDGESQPQPQTAAERTAQRRKMKRFRLTHQQTRFLMSEFAKQPHPDAAHRERLSREIPGLSPRQVQVWFQNRRAKIKRLTADDRERMIKMRAVPEDFDNLGALHSPYGAVHGLGGTPLASPVDLGGPSYADHMMRPLMVEVRRPDGEDHLSPTGLSPAFGSIGFNHPGSLSTSDILSPLSPSSTDRYGYPGHLSTTPLSSGARSSNPFARQPSLDGGMQMHHSHQSRHQIRPLQPLQLRDTMTRSRSDTLQSPLRTSMSWKGESLDYTTYQGSNGSPGLGGRQHGLYQQDSIGGTSGGSLGGYDSNNYSGSTVQSPTHLTYPNYQSPGMQQNQQRGSRMRAASTSGLPLGLDLRNQYRSAVGSGNLQQPAHSPASRTNSTPHVSSSYTASFPSAPLTAPVDFSLPRTPGFRSAGSEYSMPQMSAPIAPPTDFSQAFQASMSNSSTRTPMRDSFGGGPLGLGQNQHQSTGDRSDDYSQDPLGMKRKRSFGAPSSTANTGSSAYGSTA
ncbi:pah2 homeobox protein encoded by the pah2 protein [Podospora fimiseda]|uniref:Pah2 homeobox protein encoded by the pah2 protein n=1 Tax=Podospora fimiseda TaxID=252190 RepID=A0AAN7BUP8_9PEZI|nr:pah2 homeobox protein encoded by the pah2 protein [Podospora fimiseda]